jgi:ferredoxin
VHRSWRADARLATRLPYAALERCADEVERDLSARANLAEVLPGLPAAAAAARLGWTAEPMRRAASGCRGSGRCLQGCPTGGKASMEASFIPRAEAAGARVLADHRVHRILFEGLRAAGVLAIEPSVGNRHNSCTTPTLSGRSRVSAWL